MSPIGLAKPVEGVAADSLWQAIRDEVKRESDGERLLTSFFYSTVLNHDRLEDALSFHLADKLKSITLPAMSLREAIDEALRRSPEIGGAARADLCAVRESDPACTGYWVPLLYFKGFHALQAYRVAHWTLGREAANAGAYTSRTASPSYSASTSTPRLGSARGSSSTMPPASFSR